MNRAPGSTATTVTVFGDNDALDHALGDQLGLRGCRTHFVSVPTGWLRSAVHAVMRLDTAAGVAALEQLADTRQPRSHVIAVCPEPSDAAAADRLREMCRTCGRHHDLSLIWHPPLSPAGVPADKTAATADALAATVADEMVEHPTVGTPAFVSRPFELEPGLH
jgi:hypothetical protein